MDKKQRKNLTISSQIINVSESRSTNITNRHARLKFLNYAIIVTGVISLLTVTRYRPTITGLALMFSGIETYFYGSLAISKPFSQLKRY